MSKLKLIYEPNPFNKSKGYDDWREVSSIEDFKRLAESPLGFEVREDIGEKRPHMSVEDFRRLADSSYKIISGKSTDKDTKLTPCQLELRLKSFSQELEKYKKDLTLKEFTGIRGPKLEKLKDLANKTNSLYKQIPHNSKEYHDMITELNTDIQETIKEYSKV